MVISPPSASDLTTSFDRLHPEIRRWIREQGWQEIRPVQDEAIAALLDSRDDLIIAATTAAGKTEAAFLPLLTRIADRRTPGLSILYVSPLKALINDQFRRLEYLCERMEIDVVRWHGDAPQSAKRRTLRDPRGIALITPESIEALFLRRSTDVRNLLGSLDAIVIDELHAFLQGPRGLHLASLLHRIDVMAGNRASRVGLSATLGDPAIAARWMYQANPQAVRLIDASAGSPELRLQVRGYIDPPDRDSKRDDLEIDGGDQALDQIADHAFQVLRGTNNLFFGGSRRSVEAISDRLRRRCESAKVPNEFFPHHGSLSKELRSELEGRLKIGNLPTTAIATTTLELGIDLGSVQSVAQLGAPRSLASLRQRLGRSGRRKGSPAVLRIYLREKHVTAASDPLDRLRLETIRAVAAVRLLVARFVEPAGLDRSVTTVAIHQLLSVIAERGGARADFLFRMLCTEGPFFALDKHDFVELLRWLADPAVLLLEQAPDGTILLGEVGEGLVGGRDFYAVFQSDEEWRLTNNGRTLGTIPISNALGVGSLIAFAGQRWRIQSVDDRAKVLDVVRHPSARLPKFDRLSVEPLHDRLTAEMRAVYLSEDVPPYLDQTARLMLQEGRAAFSDLGLGSQTLIESGEDTHLILWRGTAMNAVIAIAFRAAGMECEAHDVGVTVAGATPEEVGGLLRQLRGAPTSEDLAEFVENLEVGKYDEFAPIPLLRRMWARSNEALCRELPSLSAPLSAP